MRNRDSLSKNRYQEIVNQSSDIIPQIRDFNEHGGNIAAKTLRDLDSDMSTSKHLFKEINQNNISNANFEQNYRSNPLTSLQRKRMQDIFNEELDCEYDSRPKENLP